ncbi:hypothetical protein BP00DRAFT_302850, partial [Aspergillus indologenus CBS 114.80]
ATESDAPALAALYFTCFTNAAHRRVFPPTPEMHAWWTANLRRKIASGRSVVLKVVAVDADPLPADLLHRLRAQTTRHREQDMRGVDGGYYCTSAPCHHFPSPGKYRGQCPRTRGYTYPQPYSIRGGKRILTPRGGTDLSILGTHPAYRGQGLGSRLLAWGIARARAEGRQIYLCASREGRALYVRHGFVRASEGEVV